MKKIGDKENYNNSIFENIKNIDEYVFHDSAFYNNKDNWKNGELYINNHLMAAEGIKGDYVIKSVTLTVRNCSSNKEMTSVTIPSSVTVLQYYSYAFKYSTAAITTGSSLSGSLKEYFCCSSVSLTSMSGAMPTLLNEFPL